MRIPSHFPLPKLQAQASTFENPQPVSVPEPAPAPAPSPVPEAVPLPMHLPAAEPAHDVHFAERHDDPAQAEELERQQDA